MANPCGTLSALNMKTGCVRDGYGSILSVRICYAGDLSGTCTASTGTTLLLTAIPTSGKVFTKYVPTDGLSTFQQVDPKGTAKCFDQTFTGIFTINTGSEAYQVDVLSDAYYKLIIEDGNNRFFYAGKENGMLCTATQDTSAKGSDGSKWTLVFTGQEKQPAYEVSASIIDALTI